MEYAAKGTMSDLIVAIGSLCEPVAWILFKEVFDAQKRLQVVQLFQDDHLDSAVNFTLRIQSLDKAGKIQVLSLQQNLSHFSFLFFFSRIKHWNFTTVF